MVDIDFRAGTGLSPIYPFVPTHNQFLCFYLNDQVKVSKGRFAPRRYLPLRPPGK